ncbi:MAG: aminotransferase class IV [Isosphaeraceae bacterium]
MPEPLAFLNGRMVPFSEARLPVYDAGIVLGATVTEMTRTFRHQPWKLDAHLDRLDRSLRYVRMDIGIPRERLEDISRELVAHNAGLIDRDDELGLIHFVTAGEFSVYAGSAGGSSAMTPTVCAHTFRMPFALWAGKMREGQHLVTTSTRHVPPQCFDPKMKYRSRMHYYLADLEARQVDPDASALLLDLDGNVTETGGSNFLIVERGAVVSPTTRNILPGISRATVIKLCGELGIRFLEREFQVYDVMNAEEAFTASTPYCLMPVTRINGSAVGDGKPGPIFRRLIRAWSEQVGLDIEAQILGRDGGPAE